MERHLVIILIFTGLIHLVLSVPRKYYLIQQPKTWNDSQVYCRANHEDLAVIESDENVIRFQSDMQKQNFTSSAWIGLYSDVNNWRWSLGNETVGSLKLWAAVWDQPNNGNRHEFCVGIDDYGWLDATCALLLRFVCFDDSYSGSDRYILSNSTATWYGAQSYCRLHHTDLASARNQSELSTIQAKSTTQFVWIGLYRDGWIWLDGTNFSTFPWMPGKPAPGFSENCGYLNNSQAASGQCSDILPSVCHSTITGMEQILKLKLTSSQNLNDPAIQTAILEKIRQKLMDHGMSESTTVKWRVQPDGLVFHKEKRN